MTSHCNLDKWLSNEETIDLRTEALPQALLRDTSEPVFCAVCHSTREMVLQDRALAIGTVCCVLEDEEAACECVRIDVDEDDARCCPLHGPHSALARLSREREAADLFAYYGSGTAEESLWTNRINEG